ncbi:Cro protein [Gordonia phage Leroy]|nr:Cro protein [Gordonia phage Leroy]
MNATSRDFYADCDRDMLIRAMRRADVTHEELADESSVQLRKIARSERRKGRGDSVPTSISRQLIGQLCSGKAKSTNELRGVAIERALGVDDGAIFVPRVYRGMRDANRRAS